MPFRIAFDDSGAVTLNHSLMEKLRLEFGFTVPGLSEQLPTLPGTEHVDVGEVVRRVREAIAASGLPFRVESEARLAVIAFTGYLLWRDLDAHWERFLERPLARHLALSPTDSFAAGEPVTLGDTGLDEVVATAPVPTDGSQAQAIAAARALRRSCSKGRREPASPRPSPRSSLTRWPRATRPFRGREGRCSA